MSPAFETAKTPGVFFVDTETTGLGDDAEIWEVALILPDGAEFEWQLPIQNITNADPKALQMNGFLDRYKPGSVTQQVQFCAEFGILTWGLHWGGMVPGFDEKRIRQMFGYWDHMGGGPGAINTSSLSGLFQGKGQPVPPMVTAGMMLPPNWHYHLIDVEAMAVGYVLGQADEELVLPWDSEYLSKRVGVDAADYDRHTALGDARLARDIYRAITARKAKK